MPSEDTQFKKGQSGNPEGRKPMPQYMKDLRNKTNTEIAEGIEKMQGASIKELEKFMKNPETKAYQVAMASSLVKAIKEGDWERYDRLLSRFLGNKRTILEHTGDSEKPVVIEDKMSKETRLKMEQILFDQERQQNI